MTFLTHICSHFANDKFNNQQLPNQFISKISLNLPFWYTYYLLVVGLYVGYEVNRASNKLKLKVEETLTGKVILFYIITF